jgi:D-glycero-alpha-D-manno-heptose-7-phosphate kinase
MIITKAPLRVSLFGGGSDLPAYLKSSEGAVLSFAIDKFVFLIAHPFTHRTGLTLKYSKFEDVPTSEEAEHPIFREVLNKYQINNFDIAVMSDVPAGTGLGSSSSFTVALLALAKTIKQIPFTPRDLAHEACDIEINQLGEPIGFQDQWASAIGGINIIRFHYLESVSTQPIQLEANMIKALSRNLRLVPIGEPRSASALLRRQSLGVASPGKAHSATTRLVELVGLGKKALEENLDDIGPLLNEAWQVKKQITDSVSNGEIETLVNEAKKFGSTGAKLLGAGGSGYLACYVPGEMHEKFDQKFKDQLEYSICMDGARVLDGH